MPAPASTAHPPAVVKSAALGIPGEAMEFEVFFRGMTAGRVIVGVGNPGFIENKHAIIIRSRGTSAGVISMLADLTWEMSTTLDIDTGLPIEETEEATIVLPGGKTEHSKRTRTWSDGEDRHDVHSAAGVLRAWNVPPGQPLHMPLRIDGLTIETEIREIAHESIKGHAMPTVRYEGDATTHGNTYHVWLWISDDTARVPLRLISNTKWGTIRVELVSYEAPKEPT